MNKEDKKLQKHLVDEMMKVSKTNPDVMIYMQTLMKNYEKLEQKNIDLSQQLLSKKISDKDIEYKKRKEAEQDLERYKNIIDELETYLENGIKDEKEKNIIKENLSTWQILEIILDKLKELKGSDE